MFRKLYEYIDLWGGNLVSVMRTIRAYYHFTLGFTPGQAVFGRDLLFNLTSIIDWRVVTTSKQRQVNIDGVREKSRQVRHKYTIGNLFYVKNAVIYHQLNYNNRGLYIITEVFTNSTVWVYRGAINKRINIRQIVPHFDIAEPVFWRTQNAYIWRGSEVSDNTPLQ